MYGNKIWITGITLLLAGDILPVPAVKTVGEVLAILGTILVWLDK